MLVAEVPAPLPSRMSYAIRMKRQCQRVLNFVMWCECVCVCVWVRFSPLALPRPTIFSSYFMHDSFCERSDGGGAGDLMMMFEPKVTFHFTQNRNMYTIGTRNMYTHIKHDTAVTVSVTSILPFVFTSPDIEPSFHNFAHFFFFFGRFFLFLLYLVFAFLLWMMYFALESDHDSHPRGGGAREIGSDRERERTGQEGPLGALTSIGRWIFLRFVHENELCTLLATKCDSTAHSQLVSFLTLSHFPFSPRCCDRAALANFDATANQTTQSPLRSQSQKYDRWKIWCNLYGFSGK